MQVYVNCWYVDTNSFHNTGVVFIVPQFIHVLSQTDCYFDFDGSWPRVVTQACSRFVALAKIYKTNEKPYLS